MSSDPVNQEFAAFAVEQTREYMPFPVVFGSNPAGTAEEIRKRLFKPITTPMHAIKSRGPKEKAVIGEVIDDFVVEEEAGDEDKVMETEDPDEAYVVVEAAEAADAPITDDANEGDGHGRGGTTLLRTLLSIGGWPKAS